MDAKALVQDLRQRGFRLRVDGDRLLVAPAARLTEADREAIRRCRDALVALLGGDMFPSPWRGVEVRQSDWGWVAIREPRSGRWYEIRWRDAPQWIKDRATGERAEGQQHAV